MSKRKELRKFADGDDRGATPIFAGREREIAAIRKDMLSRIDDWKGGDPKAFDSATRLIQGAPGAGKTATLEHLAGTLPSEIEGLRVCQLLSKNLDVPAYWQDEMARAFDTDLWAESHETIKREFSGKIGAEGMSAGGAYSSEKSPGDVSQWQRFKHAIKARGKNTPALLLLIDEIQNAPGERGESASAFLCAMHEAVDGLPIFPVYGGLAHSEERLDKLGISRLSDPIEGIPHAATLDPLTEHETRAVCARFFEHFEIAGSAESKERWTRKVAAGSLGWPHHVHAYLRALGVALLEVDRDLDRIGAEASDRARRLACAACERYYAKRITRPVLDGQGRLAAAAALSVAPKTDTVARLGREIERIAEKFGPEDPDMELPKGMSGKDFANAMVRAGMLHKSMHDPDGILTVPIPSFLAYLERKFGLRPGAGPKAEHPDAGAPDAGM